MQEKIWWILAVLWAFFLGYTVLGRGSARTRRVLCGILFTASLVAIVLLVRHVNHLHRVDEPYSPADEEAAPAPYHVRLNDWEQV